jgi:hypothetical protein
MATIAMSPPAAPMCNVAASNLGNLGPDDIVEISLLLPSRWANDLIDLARERRQSVGEVIRSMIGRALYDAGSGC